MPLAGYSTLHLHQQQQTRVKQETKRTRMTARKFQVSQEVTASRLDQHQYSSQ